MQISRLAARQKMTAAAVSDGHSGRSGCHQRRAAEHQEEQRLVADAGPLAPALHAHELQELQRKARRVRVRVRVSV